MPSVSCTHTGWDLGDGGDGEAGRRGFVLRTGCSKIWIGSLLHGAGY